MRLLALTTVLSFATACAAVPPPRDEVPVHGDVGGSCDARAAQDLVGRQAESAIAAEAQRLSRAPTIRWLRPGDVVTMEYSPSRLNIHLDERHRVNRLICG